MRKVCCWCGRDMGTVPDTSLEGLEIEGEPVSHGLCEACKEAMGDDVMGPPHRLYDEDKRW